MANKFLSGKTSRIAFTSNPVQNLNLGHYTAEWKADDVPTDNFEANGYHTHINAMQGLDVIADGVWDGNQAPLSDPPGFYPRDNGGADGTQVQVYISNQQNLNKMFGMSLWTCTRAHIDAKANGSVAFTGDLHSNGSFTTP